MFSSEIAEILYFISCICIVLGLRFLGRTESAKRGNYFLGFGMGLGVFTTLLKIGTSNLGWIFSAIIIGSVMGILSARKVRLTSAPQILSLFNAFGGVASTITAYIAFTQILPGESAFYNNKKVIFILVSSFFGTVSFSGSILSIIKLRRILPEAGLSFPLQKILNFSTLTAVIILSFFILAKAEIDIYLLYLHIFLSVVYGIFFFLPIGGIDSPISISFLNSYSGISLAFSGLIYSNQLMLISGIFVGVSGLLLTIINAGVLKRPFFRIIFGGSTTNIPSPYYHLGMPAREITISDASILLKYSKKILMIPGYGMGITQTQFSLKELDEQLSGFGVEVDYAIHPYGGRTPGHINILLAEANIPYEKIRSINEVNKNIEKYDLVVCIGANDIINPYIDRDKKNPLYGLPKIELNRAKNIIILKRTLQPGFSGVENQLFFEKNTQIILGNLKTIFLKLINSIREI